MSERRGFTEHPVFVETPVGAIGGIVTSPDGPPAAAAIVLVGRGQTRAGANSLWARLTRSLAEVRVVSVRADYAGFAESQSMPLSARAEGIDHTVRWFRERTANQPLLVIGHCLGALLARDVARCDPDFIALAAISPPLGAAQWRAVQSSMSLRRRAHVALYHAKKSALRGAVRARYGRGPYTGYADLDEFTAIGAPDVIESLADTGRTWFLTGEGDFATEPLRSLEAEMSTSGSALEVLPFGIYPSATPEAQRAIIDRTVAWARTCVRALEVGT